MTFSIVPVLFGAIVAFWLCAAHAARRRAQASAADVRAIYVWVAVLSAWGVASAVLSMNGAYRSDSFFRLLPGLWVPLAPVLLSLGLLFSWPAFRAALWTVTRSTSPRAFFLLHGLRVAAVGGILKAYQGLLPASFAYPVGIPDLAFGVGSLALFAASRTRDIGTGAIVGWNLTGMAVLASAPVLMQLGLPGPFQVLRGPPDASALFEFPMVLAPTLVVTWLFFINGWHAWVVWRSGRAAPFRTERPNPG